MKCCICNKKIDGIGNNPRGVLTLKGRIVPWRKNDRCCDACYMESVLPCKVLTYFKKKGSL